MNRIPSNIIVTVPDLSAVAADARSIYNDAAERNGTRKAIKMTFYTWGYVQTQQGMFCLTDEGVGPIEPVTAENVLDIGFYAEHEDGSSILPDARAHLSDMELMCLPTLREVPLEQFIRSFGNRLECNYELWLLRLTEAKPMSLDNCR